MIERFGSLVAHLHKDESGQGLVEYVLVVSLLVLSCLTFMSGLADELNSALSKVASTVHSAVGS